MKSGIKTIINGEEFLLIKDYKDEKKYRQSLNKLANDTYGFDFEQWYQYGYWTNKYRPYSFLHNGEVVANISVNPIDYLEEGILHTTLQIGTVMTDKAYRMLGLSRVLMNIVLSEYENSCELFYLYANDTVLDFYPKFGFEKAQEYLHTKLVKEQKNKLNYRKLNMQNDNDKNIITRLVTNSLPFSKFTMIDNPYLMMFHLTSYMSGDLYYIDELDLAAVVNWDEEGTRVTDLFSEQEFDFELVIGSFVNKPQSKVILGFTPMEDYGFAAELLQEEGSTFFVKGSNFLKQGRFPVLSHA